MIYADSDVTMAHSYECFKQKNDEEVKPQTESGERQQDLMLEESSNERNESTQTNELKTYIFITGIANIVAGGPIYVRNKIRYLQERGWNVEVFPIDDGEIYIHGLEQYQGMSCPFLTIMPGEYTKRKRESLLKQLISRVSGENGEIIIETGTDYSAYWGELLAAKLNARHFVIWLDEKNPNIGKREQEFLAFKYKRHELACITKRAMIQLFEGYWMMTEEEAYGLSCYCANVMEDYENDLTEKIPKGDYIIGSIGRLEKPFVPKILDGIIEFANSVPDKKVVICLFGGTDDEIIIQQIKKKFKTLKNIEVFITGYIYPLPKKALKKCNIFASCAGSRLPSAKAEVPTIAIDMYTGEPVGYVVSVAPYREIQYENVISLKEYLDAVLVEKRVPKMDICGNENEWNYICNLFDEHMEFLKNGMKKKEYFPEKKVVRLYMKGYKKKIKKIMRFCIGDEATQIFLRQYIKLKKLRQRII